MRIAGLVASALTLMFVIMIFALWQYRSPLLNNLARPRLEQFLATTFEARVTIEQLALDTGKLRVRGITVDHTDLYRVTVSGLILDFTLAKLLSGRLSALQVELPEIYFKPALISGTDRSAPINLRKPPIRIDRLTVNSGRLDLELTNQTVAVRAIEFNQHDAPSGMFHLSLTVQEGQTPLKLSTSGQVQWAAEPELQLDEFNLDGRSLLTAPLTLRPAADGLVAGGELVMTQVDRTQLDSWLALGRMQQRLPPDVDFSAQNLRLGVEIRAGKIHGELSLDAIQLTKSDVRSQLNNVLLNVSGDPGQWHATGEARLAEGSPVSLTVQGTDKHVAATAQGTFLDLARIPKIVGQEQTLPVSGGLEWTARAEWLDQYLELSGEFHGVGPPPSAGTMTVNISPLRGNFEVKGSIDNLTGNLNLDLAKVPLLTLAGNSEQLIAQLYRTSISSLAKTLSLSRWPHLIENKGWLTGQMQLNPETDRIRGHFNFTGENLQAAGFDFATSRVSSRFFWQQEQLVLTDLSLDSAMTGHGLSIPVATLQGSARWHATTLQLDIASLMIENLEYLSADNMSALAGGALDLTGKVVWDQVQQRLHSRLKGSTLVQEALLRSFYGNLSQLPVDFDLQADWNNASELLQLDGITLSLPAIGQLKGHGSWHSEVLKFSGEFVFSQLETGFNLHLRPLLATLSTKLEQLDLSGTLAAVGAGSWGTDGWKITGVLHPDTFSLQHRTANFSILDLSGEIPFMLSSGDETSGVAHNGFLAFSQLQSGPVDSAASYLTFTATTNRLTFMDPWKLNLASGQILIENLGIGHGSAGLSISGHSRIEHIDLQELTQALELTPMQGSLTADLGEFEYLDGMLQSEGEAHIDVFGGTMQIRNLRARDIFSSYRSLEGDIDFHGIDLEQLTRTFAFGEINGIMDGYIHELRLFGKVPSAFVAEVSTREQGQRNISVKALNNLTVISQGGLSAALSRGVYRFIDFYRYRKIGLFCVLRNDVFVLKGTARSDSDLHLVDGGLLPPRIDILAPGTGISFREMLRRLERIDRTATR
jgi:hypothetical protein